MRTSNTVGDPRLLVIIAFLVGLACTAMHCVAAEKPTQVTPPIVDDGGDPKVCRNGPKLCECRDPKCTKEPCETAPCEVVAYTGPNGNRGRCECPFDHTPCAAGCMPQSIPPAVP